MRISIVTISFNQAEFLSACLRSVAGQLKLGDAHIGVDPGSTDGSRELLSAQGNVRCLFQKDAGPADGLNRGFAAADGEIFGFINADDALAPGALGYVRDFFQANPGVDIVVGAVRVIDARGQAQTRKRVSSAPSLEAIASGAMAFYQQGMFFRRRVWSELGVRFNAENRTCWDYEFLADALRAGATAKAVTRELGWFRLHTQSITGSGRTNAQYALDRSRIERGAAATLMGERGAMVRRIVTKLDPVRRVAEWTSWGDAPESESQNEIRRPSASVVIAWQELPFYARRCVAVLVRRRPDWDVVVITSKLRDDPATAEAQCGCRIRIVDSEKAVSFAELALPVPEHFFATSWRHGAYRALGEEVRRAGGGVTMLADNNFLGTMRQWLGALYFRAHLCAAYDAAWVPGESGRRFMEVMGMASERVFTGLYAADGDVFYPPHEREARSGVVYVGQLIARKRVVELWRAWQSVGGAEKLTMFGEGALHEQLATVGAPLAGGLDAARLAERLRASSALILVSTVDHWGLVVHEAALCGCLLLVTATCGAAADLVVHRENGYVMDEFSEETLSEALAWMRSLTAQDIAKGRALSVELAKGFSPERWAARAVRIMAIQAAERARRVI
jgi:glycosyltransferase involved in cell wall biosynthesis